MSGEHFTSRGWNRQSKIVPQLALNPDGKYVYILNNKRINGVREINIVTSPDPEENIIFLAPAAAE